MSTFSNLKPDLDIRIELLSHKCKAQNTLTGLVTCYLKMFGTFKLKYFQCLNLNPTHLKDSQLFVGLDITCDKSLAQV